MSLKPYIPDPDVWKYYFSNPSREYREFYTVSKSKQQGNGDGSIKLVSPTAHAIEQAKATIAEVNKTSSNTCKNKKRRIERSTKKTV